MSRELLGKLAWPVLFAALVHGGVSAAAEAIQAPPAVQSAPENARVNQPQIVDLGGGRLGIGEIVVDRETRSFSVTGRVIRTDPPLEYAAVRKEGPKAYESLLELDSDAFQFNLACILIGLDSDRATLSRWHFDPQPVVGDEVEVKVSWQEEGRQVTRPLHALLTPEQADEGSGKWVYTGSTFDFEGRYLPEDHGTLIGFSHDPDSIIEHRDGIGLNDYGAIGGLGSFAIGTPVKVIIRALSRVEKSALPANN